MTQHSFEENNIWQTITDKVDNVHGWSPIEQLYSLYMLGLMTRDLDGDIIEVGSWGGRSAISLGLAAKESGKSKVHAIDYFPNADDWKENMDGTYSFKIELGGNLVEGHGQQTVWKEPFENSIKPFYQQHPNLLNYFNKNIADAGLTEYVTPFKGNSDLFIKSLSEDFRCRMVYIDGEHSAESVRNDINNFKNILVKDGVICFDDAFSGYEGVDKAINELIIYSNEFHSFSKLTRKLFIAFKK